MRKIVFLVCLLIGAGVGHQFTDSFWVGCPIMVVVAFVAFYLCVILDALLDKEQRFAAKLNINPHRLSFYRLLFQQIADADERQDNLDEETIQKLVPDMGEWQRYCQWELAQGMKAIQKYRQELQK